MGLREFRDIRRGGRSQRFRASGMAARGYALDENSAWQVLDYVANLTKPGRFRRIGR